MNTSLSSPASAAIDPTLRSSTCCGPVPVTAATPTPASGCCGGDAAVPAADDGAAPTTLAAGEALVGAVRERYAEIASAGLSCCGPTGCAVAPDPQDLAAGLGYSVEDLAAVPVDANLGLGCGAPLAHLALTPGETVLDLGSGPGLDAILAARRVGPDGVVIGVDMTPEMLVRARANVARAGLSNIDLREGRLEALPVADASVDAVTSNCVINLVPDKAQVFREIGRVLRPGGRLVISDIVLDGELPASVMSAVEAYVGCIAGAARRGEYLTMLEQAGLGDVEILASKDYAAVLLAIAPDEAARVLEGTGLAPESLLGVVTSLTFRARKPAIAAA